jgi:hypothetical protein
MRRDREGVFMKKFSLVMLALALALGLAFSACDNGTTREPETFSGTVGSAAYTLTISPPQKRAVLEGDEYELTIVQSGATKTSTGTVKTVNQGTFTLLPDIADSPGFTVTTNGASITTITGSITLEDSTSAAAPGAVSISGTYTYIYSNQEGTWVYTITFTGSNFVYKKTGPQNGELRGTFTVVGNIITCTSTYAGGFFAGDSLPGTMTFTIVDSNTINEYRNAFTR